MTGRPSSYATEKADLICALLAEGRSLRSICREPDMPCMQTVFNWLRTEQGFLEQYTRAREAQADCLFEETLEIADDARNDWMEANGEEDAGWRLNGEHIQRSRLRVDTRKWAAGKLAPKKYGERVTTELQALDANGQATNLSVAVEFIAQKHEKPADDNSNT